MPENNNYFNQDHPPRYTAIVQDIRKQDIYRCNHCGLAVYMVSDETSEKFPQYCVWCDSIFTSVSKLIPKQSNLKDEDNADNHTFFYRLKLSICNFFNKLRKSLHDFIRNRIEEEKWKTET